MSTPLKILLVHCSYRYFGGEDRVFFQEREALRQQLGENAMFEYHVTTPSGSPLFLFIRLLWPVGHSRQIRRLIREHKINLVHVHNFFPLLTLSVFKIAHKAGAVVVHTLHNYRWWCAGAELYRKGQGVCELCVTSRHSLQAVRYGCYRNSRLQSLLAVWLLQRAKALALSRYIDHFIVLSAFQQNWVSKSGIAEHKISLKPNGVKARSVCPVSEKSGFVYAGRLEPSKGVEQVLECWQQYSLTESLTLVGTGSLEQELKNKYGHLSQIHFMGACSPQETLSIIDRSRFLIQPSLWYETFGLTIVEAMQLGVPVIGYAIGTRPDFITDGVNGFLCSPDTLGATLQKAIVYESYDTLSVRAQETGQHFLSDVITEKQVQLYRQWIEPKSSGAGR